MKDIIRLTGIPRKVINSYFPTKVSLLSTCINYQVFQEKLFRYMEENLLDLLINYAENFPRLYKNINPRCCSDIKKYYPSLYTSLTGVTDRYAITCREKVKKGIESGYIRKSTSPDLIYIFLQDNFSRLLGTTAAKQEYNEQIMTEMILVFIRGISTSRGQKYMRKIKNKNTDEID